jgi:predicted LPLAT superfamily acyltransferase
MKARRRGNRLGFWLFATTTRWLGLRGAYLLLRPVAGYYALCDRAAVAATRPYLCRRFPQANNLRLRLLAWRIFVEQGITLIDRYYLMTGGKQLLLNVSGLARVQAVLADGHGLVLLTSHFGAWQTVMPALQKLGRPVFLVMRPEQNQAVLEALQVSKDTGTVQIIPADDFVGHAGRLVAALSSGGIVAIMGDRHYGAATLPVKFLGEPAFFPYSALAVAAATRSPVSIMLAAKTGPYSYQLELSEPFQPSYDRTRPKQAQLADWLQVYVSTLERFAQRYPFQCFLFQDVWQAPTPAAGPTGRVTTIPCPRPCV